MPEQSGLLREFARQKGLATFDDVESEPAFEMKACHELIVNLEHCTSQRPSDHLRGSNTKYTNQMSMLSGCLEPAAGNGELHMRVNEGEGSSLPSAMGRSSRRSPSKRPGSAAPGSPTRASTGGTAASGGLLRVDTFGNPIGKSFTGDEKYPRVGSFEVHVTLHNKEFQRRYGPVLVYSKIKSGQWPSFTKLRKTVDAVMQQLLAEDDQACALEKEFRKQNPAPPVENEGPEDSGEHGGEADEENAAAAEAATAAVTAAQAAAVEIAAAEAAAAAASAAEASAAEAVAAEPPLAAAATAAAPEAAVSALSDSPDREPAEIGMLARTNTNGAAEIGSRESSVSEADRTDGPGDQVDGSS
mmetsp:Transcript_26061/g.84100  ORF Transcript_26061/g.84100 Transcript_26061/m.84100 type:complete len:358 (-) Transcript_26061:667-1740(-)